MYALHHTPATGGEEERDIEPIKCSAHHTADYRWRGESDIAPTQVYVLTTQQLQVEMRERIEPILKCMRSPPQPATGGEERET